ncbi:TPA: 30S ribosomal protein S18 [Candidatus Uhrbacteria bacterium]|uniref:Small ribosomal subunit protein bS18 n=1 Tax=Candidatus Uhrbacteria bacterium CG10_big_fil_rev_8_21_14_0_10_50_16 TaxID=1975039 RepID=A0A2H0RMN6_9BACT|nr:MAG: 30S ribosomal protein S18 [Candidatus Uhrbacteria bacterium CG10_big_fil_rev_8_21_14_0_10_50_16]HBU28148.1 30S ribosomal protein S18 [Candidatus Uhrbacteria bacterium]
MNKIPGKSVRKPFTCPKADEIDYKDIGLLRRFLSSYGKIVPRRRSGISAKQQRAMARAIKRARIMALVPFENK